MADGCDAVLANVTSYIGCLVTFIIIFALKMPDLPFPLIGNLLEDSQENIAQNVVRYILFAMWCMHFLRRIIEVLFVHIYNRRMPWVETIGGPIYYWFFALFNAWAIDRCVYKSTYLPLVVIGILVFVIGEIGNGWCHFQLRCFRTKDYEESELVSVKTGRVIPHGGLFNLVSCPHYFYEIVTWLGYFMVAWTLWSLLFLTCTVITLVIYSNKKHSSYLSEFNGNHDKAVYPKRKRLIPFLF